MTSIAFDGKHLAADTGVSISSIRLSNYNKIFYNRSIGENHRRDKWFVAACSGATAHCEELRRVLLGEQDSVDKDLYDSPTNAHGLIIYQDLKPRFIYANGKVSDPLDSTYMANGWGTEFLMGALSVGASALKAVEYAALYSDGTHGNVYYVDLQHFFSKESCISDIILCA